MRSNKQPSQPNQLRAVAGRHPVAPPVYRPQPVPVVLQAKSAQPKAPPAYRPNPLPRVLQTKQSSFASAVVNTPRRNTIQPKVNQRIRPASFANSSRTIQAAEAQVVVDLVQRDRQVLTKIHRQAFQETQGEQNLQRILEVKAFLRDIPKLTQCYQMLNALVARNFELGAASYPRALDMALQDTERKWMQPGRIKIGAVEVEGEKGFTTLTHQRWNEKEKRWETASTPERLDTAKGLTPEQLTKHVLSHGMPFKDVGAPLTHGEYAHRIQWFCLYQHFVSTQQWNPDDLITLWKVLGNQVLIGRNCIGEMVSLWDSVLDVRGTWAQGKRMPGGEVEKPLEDDYKGAGHAVPVNVTNSLSWIGTDVAADTSKAGGLVSPQTSSLAAAIGVRKTKRSALRRTGKEALTAYNQHREKLRTPEAVKRTVTHEGNPK